RRSRDEPRQLAAALDRLAVEADDDVARLDPGGGGRTVAIDVGDQRTLGTIEAEVLGDRRRHRLDADAEPAALDLAGGAQLLDDRPRQVGRNGEADADRAARRRIDRRVDADD